jgi:hypothetical protein
MSWGSHHDELRMTESDASIEQIEQDCDHEDVIPRNIVDP